MKNHGFELKIEREMHDYLSCKIEFSKDRDKIWIGQPHVGEYRLWTSKRTENRQLNERDYTIDKYKMLAVC